MKNLKPIGWIVKNLGITRKTIYYYEKCGFIKPVVDQENRYRYYSDEEIEKIWFIKLLISWGFTTEELNDVIFTENFEDNIDLSSILDQKICKLEKNRKEIDLLITAAKYVKLTGSIPYPKKMGELSFYDYLETIQKELIIPFQQFENSYSYESIQNTVKNMDNSDESLLSELTNVLDKSQFDLDLLFSIFNIIITICSNTQLDSADKHIQQLVKEMHMATIRLFGDYDKNITSVDYFCEKAQVYFWNTGSDLNRMSIKLFGEQKCEFLSLAIFFYQFNQRREEQS